MHERGFTLIEVIVYIGLFALLIGGFFITAYQILSYSSELSLDTSVQDELNFVMGKIEWAMQSMETINGTGSSLDVTHYDGTSIVIDSSGGAARINENSAGFVPLTTGNVVVAALTFDDVPASGSGPAGVSATLTIRGANDSTLFTASTTRYLRN